MTDHVRIRDRASGWSDCPGVTDGVDFNVGLVGGRRLVRQWAGCSSPCTVICGVRPYSQLVRPLGESSMSLAFALWFAKTTCPTNTTLIGRNQPMAHHLLGQPVGTSHLFFCMFHFFFRRQERRTERLLPCGHDHADSCPCLHQLVTLMLVSEPATI